MSVGQTHVSAKFVSNMSLTGLASLWASDTIKMGIVTNTSPPAITDSDPRWGSGGSQNYSTPEVTPGGNYSAGGVTLTSPTSTLSGAVASLNATSPITIAANASNPTGAYWAVFYDSTDAGKHVFGRDAARLRKHQCRFDENGAVCGPLPRRSSVKAT